ncbi:MAG: HAD-IC family P-type ATPase, partial [Oscillospiraceae bacterium]|nr:HAD-IC family P-type ATPase [Oscillospiraceae bacterium]
LPGNGLSATLDGAALLGGSVAFISAQTALSDALRARADALAEQGNTPLLFTRDGALLGIIAVADVIKEDSPQAVRELQNMGIRVVMLTGDNERTAKAIGALSGVDEVISGVLPDGKEAVIRTLQQQGKVAMVGDGINDAPALTRADIGIAIGAGTDVAIDAADVVLMKSRLSDVPAAVRLSRATLRNIHENLFWAFFYNAVCIPLAAGAFVRFGLTLNPMVGAAAMSMSSFCVVTNALRLNLFRMHDASHDKPKKHKPVTPQAEPAEIKEETTMANTITLDVEGMMCVHCEARVKKALEAVEGVVSATASHESNTAVVETNGKVDAEALKAAVEAQDYKVLGVRA